MRFLVALALLLLAATGVFLLGTPSPEATPETTDAVTATKGPTTLVPPPTTGPPTTTSSAPVADQPPMLGQALSLTDLDGWLQTEIADLDELRGQVVVVWFWTFGCYNCKNTIPYLQDVYAEYHDRGLEIVGVHSPEFDYERDPESILAAAHDLGVTWPIALDTKRRNFHAWQGSPAYWPRTYVLDQDGLIRFDHIGEGGYDELEETVAALLDL